jgi:hypothetical protein
VVSGQLSVGEVVRSGRGGVRTAEAGPAGKRVLGLCCAWDHSLDDGDLTFAFTSGDAATLKVMRAAVQIRDAALPELALTEVAPDRRPDITIAYVVRCPTTARARPRATSTARDSSAR